MSAWVTAAVFILLAAACWTDLRQMVIPNILTAGFAAAGLVFHTVFGEWTGLLQAIAGGAAGMLPLLPLYRFKGLGAGDVKWFGAFGIWAGPVHVLQLTAYSILFGGAIALVLLLLRMPLFRPWAARVPWPWGAHPLAAGKGGAFPFMLAVAPGFAWMIGSASDRLL